MDTQLPTWSFTFRVAITWQSLIIVTFDYVANRYNVVLLLNLSFIKCRTISATDSWEVVAKSTITRYLICITH